MTSKHRFTMNERHAVFTTHGGRCWLCGEPIDMLTFEVDHILPESLFDDAGELARVRALYGLPATFEINSYENWLPSCRPCNGRKSNTIFNPTPIIQLHLQRATARAESARDTALRAVAKGELAKAATVFERARAQGLIQLPEAWFETALALVDDYAEHIAPDADREVVRVTPENSVRLYEVISDDGLVSIARGPYGVGGGPSAARPIPGGMRCHCGSTYFNGARCVVCGELYDD